MTDENKNEKQGFFSKTWVRVTAGVLGGTIILSGTFVTGAVAGAKADDRGFDRMAHATSFENRQHQGVANRGELAHRGGGQGHFGASAELRGGPGSGVAELDEEQRLEQINEWLESLGIESLDQLPADLSGTPEELREKRQLEGVNKRLERLGLDPIDQLPEGYPNS